MTVKDAYPLLRIDDALDQLAEAKWFHTLDLASGYWQVAMNPDSRERTAFCTHLSLHEWLVMPVGLCNASAMFEPIMERVLAGLEWHGESSVRGVHYVTYKRETQPMPCYRVTTVVA